VNPAGSPAQLDDRGAGAGLTRSRGSYDAPAAGERPFDARDVALEGLDGSQRRGARNAALGGLDGSQRPELATLRWKVSTARSAPGLATLRWKVSTVRSVARARRMCAGTSRRPAVRRGSSSDRAAPARWLRPTTEHVGHRDRVCGDGRREWLRRHQIATDPTCSRARVRTSSLIPRSQLGSVALTSRSAPVCARRRAARRALGAPRHGPRPDRAGRVEHGCLFRTWIDMTCAHRGYVEQGCLSRTWIDMTCAHRGYVDQGGRWRTSIDTTHPNGA